MDKYYTRLFIAGVMCILYLVYSRTPHMEYPHMEYHVIWNVIGVKNLVICHPNVNVIWNIHGTEYRFGLPNHIPYEKFNCTYYCY